MTPNDDRRFKPLAFALAVGCVIAWFLWPFDRALRDPAGSAVAIVRAVALFSVVLGHANFVASLSPAYGRWLPRLALGFVIAFTIGVAISLAFKTLGSPLEADPRTAALDALADAFACAVALGLYDRPLGRDRWGMS